MHKLTISMPDQLAAKFFAIIGKGDRSHFIAAAVQEKLEKDARSDAVQELLAFSPIKSSADSTTILRELRAQRNNELAKHH